MSVPLPTYTPKPPAPPPEEYAGLEELDRPELDDQPDTERDPLPALGWEDDGESGIKPRRR
jgi:hypothetical protein